MKLHNAPAGKVSTRPIMPEHIIKWQRLERIPRDIPPDTTVLSIGLVGGLTEIDWLPPKLVSLNVNQVPLERIICALPETLVTLNLVDTPIAELPVLPAGLKHLFLGATKVRVLPRLPPTLHYLSIQNNHCIQELPEHLPQTLHTLDIKKTKISRIPPLPLNLQRLNAEGTPLEMVPVGFERMVPPYSLKLGEYRYAEIAMCDNLPHQGIFEDTVSWWARLIRERARQLMAPLKEELMAAAWHPRRVERWLEAGLELEEL